MEIVEEHRIGYSNCHAGVHELAWAQGEMLSYIHTRGPGNLVYVTKFGALDGRPVDLEGVLEAVRLTYEGNDALRTRYVRRDGRWVQEILGSGEISVAELSSTSPQLDAAQAVALLGPLSPAPGEVPARVAVITYEGRPTHVYLAVHHASVDNMGAEIACQEICRRSLGLSVLTSSSWQPHRIVEFEASTAGRALAERSDRYHRARFRELAAFDAPAADRTRTPLREYRLTSPAVVAAAQQISQRVNVSALNVALAAYCVVLSGRLSRDRFPLALTSGNRFAPNLRMSVAKLAQASSLCVDTAAPTFGEFCRRMNSAALLAYRHGVYDPALMERLYDEMEAEYGRRLFFPFLVNLNLTTPVESLAEPRSSLRRQLEANLAIGPRELRRLLERGVCAARDPEDGVRFTDLTLDVYEFSGRADLRLRTDLSYFPDADVQDLLLSTERLLVEIACADGDVEFRHLAELAAGGGVLPGRHPRHPLPESDRTTAVVSDL